MTLINVYHVCLFYMAFITFHYYVINCHHVVIVFGIVLIMFQRFVWSICIILLLFWHGLYHNSSFVSLFSALCNCFHLPSIMFHHLANQCSSFCHCFCFFLMAFIMLHYLSHPSWLFCHCCLHVWLLFSWFCNCFCGNITAPAPGFWNFEAVRLSRVSLGNSWLGLRAPA